jgi:hypothetical protein
MFKRMGISTVGMAGGDKVVHRLLEPAERLPERLNRREVLHHVHLQLFLQEVVVPPGDREVRDDGRDHAARRLHGGPGQ